MSANKVGCRYGSRFQLGENNIVLKIMKSVATLATAESGKYKDNYYKSPKVEKNKIKHMLTYVKSK